MASVPMVERLSASADTVPVAGVSGEVKDAMEISEVDLDCVLETRAFSSLLVSNAIHSV